MALLADRGYDADAIREEIAFHGVHGRIDPSMLRQALDVLATRA